MEPRLDYSRTPSWSPAPMLAMILGLCSGPLALVFCRFVQSLFVFIAVLVAILAFTCYARFGLGLAGSSSQRWMSNIGMLGTIFWGILAFGIFYEMKTIGVG